MTVLRSADRARVAVRSPVLWLLRVAAAGLLVTSGLIHLHLRDIAYRHVGTLAVLAVEAATLVVLALTGWVMGRMHLYGG